MMFLRQSIVPPPPLHSGLSEGKNVKKTIEMNYLSLTSISSHQNILLFKNV
jgi:hypothetical protein